MNALQTPGLTAWGLEMSVVEIRFEFGGKQWERLLIVNVRCAEVLIFLSIGNSEIRTCNATGVGKGLSRAQKSDLFGHVPTQIVGPIN